MAKSKAKLSDFRTQERNLNKHRPRGMGMLDNVIAKDGWQGAITTAANGETFAGSARLEVAQERFGDESEPIVFDIDGTRPVILRRIDIPTADDPRAIRLGIADNRISELNYDPDIELLSAIADEVDISDMYFEAELKALIEADQRENEEEYPDQKEEEDEDALERSLDNVGKVESRVKLGEIWQLGRHKIACGDSTIETNVRALLGDRFGDVGMVWADPPYGISHSGKGIKGDADGNDFGEILNDGDVEIAKNSFSLCKKLFKDSNLIFWGANYYPSILSDGYGWMVWDKQREGETFSGAELAFVNKGIRLDVFRHQWHGMIKASEHGQKRVHPTQKPIALCEWAFDKYGQSNDIILDPFLGSAPSIIAAQKMEGDRTVYGFELSPDYCEVIIQRYENFTGDIAKLVGHL
jgi:hypothetical protein